MANPFDACAPVTIAVNLETEKPFVLVKRGGGCTFVTKVRNCQASGASLVIIMDDSIEQTERIVMSDDGFGYTVSTPSIFIGERNGEKIVEYLGNQSEPIHNNALNDMTRHGKHAILVMKFDVIKSENVQKSIYKSKTNVKFAMTF